MTPVTPAAACEPPQQALYLSPAPNDGDWQQWDSIWKSAAGRPEIIFTRQTPRTLTQLMHRAYFEDLWHWMGQRAPGARFLELGSGRGTMSMYLAERGCDVTLLDRSPAALALAREYFAACELSSPHTVLDDATATGLPDASFDCIYNTGVLEHFEDPVPVLREALRLLKTGGLLFMIVVPQTPWMRGLPLRLAFNPLPALWQAAKQLVKWTIRYRSRQSNAGVRTAFSREQWADWLHDLGQTRVECLPYNPLHHVYGSAALERTIAVPVLAMHLARRRRRGRYPLLRTWAAVARCDLLVCWKQ